MLSRPHCRRSPTFEVWLLSVLWIAALVLSVPTAGAQDTHFEVASIRQNNSDENPSTNVPLTQNDFYPPNQGSLTAKNIPLLNFIAFAYKLTAYQEHFLLDHAPAWIGTTRFNVEARAEGTPNKEEMRIMMRSLLADRFGVIAHFENRELPIFELVFSKPAQLGPDLKPAKGEGTCPSDTQSRTGAKLISCSGFNFAPPSAPGRRHIVGQAVTLDYLAGALTGLGNVGRPIFNHTGLADTFDFTLEWTPDSAAPSAASPGSEMPGPGFLQALSEELGLRLLSGKGLVNVLLLDHVAPPSAN